MDILHRMLSFLPEERITVEEALQHPYLKDFHGQMEEPNCPSVFDFEFEKGDRLSMGTDDENRQEVRNGIFEEVLCFRPAALAAVQEAQARHAHSHIHAAEAKHVGWSGGGGGGGGMGSDHKGGAYTYGHGGMAAGAKADYKGMDMDD